MGIYPVFRFLWGGFRVVLSVVVVFGGVVSFLPVIGWRGFVCFVARWFGYGRVLTDMDMIMFEGYRGSSFPLRNVLVFVVEVDGGVGVKEVCEVFERVSCGFVEMRMFVGSVLGFKCFKRVDGFSVTDHVVEVGGVCGGDSVHEFLLNRGFVDGRSPWEVCLFGDRVIGFRIHHCVADGLSILKMFVEGVGGGVVKGAGMVKCRKLPFKQRFDVFGGVGVDLVEYWVDSLVRRDLFYVRRGGRRVCSSGGMFCFERVRGVAKGVGVCGSSVMIAGILGGFSKFVGKELGKVGTGVRCGYVLPVSGHPGLLCNHWRTSYMTIMEEAAAPPSAHTLKAFNRAFLKLKTGSRSVFLKYSILYGGSCVSPLSRILLRNRVVPVGITNIAGNDESFCVLGRECVGYSLSSGGFSGLGLMFCVITYKQEFRVLCVADETVLSRSECQVLSGYIDREFDEIFCGVGGVV